MHTYDAEHYFKRISEIKIIINTQYASNGRRMCQFQRNSNVIEQKVQLAVLEMHISATAHAKYGKMMKVINHLRLEIETC